MKSRKINSKKVLLKRSKSGRELKPCEKLDIF